MVTNGEKKLERAKPSRGWTRMGTGFGSWTTKQPRREEGGEWVAWISRGFCWRPRGIFRSTGIDWGKSDSEIKRLSNHETH